MKKKDIFNNKGITGLDLTIGLIVLATFAGLLVMLMYNVYKTAVEIQRSSNAMAYITIVMEKVDEKAYDEVNDEFVTTLKNSGEIKIEDGFDIEFSVQDELEENLFKKVRAVVKYDVNGEEKSIVITKLKVKEIYKE